MALHGHTPRERKRIQATQRKTAGKKEATRKTVRKGKK